MSKELLHPAYRCGVSKVVLPPLCVDMQAVPAMDHSPRVMDALVPWIECP